MGASSVQSHCQAHACYLFLLCFLFVALLLTVLCRGRLEIEFRVKKKLEFRVQRKARDNHIESNMFIGEVLLPLRLLTPTALPRRERGVQLGDAVSPAFTAVHYMRRAILACDERERANKKSKNHVQWPMVMIIIKVQMYV
jgi:hypothetical protein